MTAQDNFDLACCMFFSCAGTTKARLLIKICSSARHDVRNIQPQMIQTTIHTAQGYVKYITCIITTTRLIRSTANSLAVFIHACLTEQLIYDNRVRLHGSTQNLYAYTGKHRRLQDNVYMHSTLHTMYKHNPAIGSTPCMVCTIRSSSAAQLINLNVTCNT